ncbi:MAG: antibiotic biosynthesis monooxygenase [Hyphomicrobiaceae bacterium]
MVHLTVILTVKSETDVPFVREKMTELGRLAHQDRGCVRFEVYHSQADRRVLFLNEIWEDQSALDEHRAMPAFTETYMKTVVPKLERAPHPCDRLV